jgi:NADPH2:quinone reductase
MTMLIVEAARFGGPQMLAARPAPDPVADPGQVVVRTSAADVLFVDTAIRAGRAAGFFPIRPPYVPGNGIAGRVISLGAGVGPG